MSRAVYALIIDCTDESIVIPALLEQVQTVIAERGWPEVRNTVVQTDIPMPDDERRQDHTKTTPETRLVDTGQL